MVTLSRKSLNANEVKSLFEFLDSSFALRLQETLDLEVYSMKLATHAKFELAELEGVIIGTIAFYTNETKNELYVPYVCVQSVYRRQGIADMLMTDFCSYADNMKMSISLEVRKSNKGAIRLYEKYGFQLVSENDIKLYMTRKWM